ncbi:hypothetical protein M378DRAFT_14773 [Amanita muscaria Koide BX008]|uniref:Uncharacterized protein n=1 Tax=Amanita muscaria (strain Koide BX008) TaxID=946122 RepID=A0A0C2WDX5_AMAMK|nr:hypothetical protein M378DRAFT_14773 [Amanita muscaria Koide BX008]
MDDMDGPGQVIIIGATSHLDAVDPALRREGEDFRNYDLHKGLGRTLGKGLEAWRRRRSTVHGSNIECCKKEIHKLTDRLLLKAETGITRVFMISIKKTVSSSAKSSSPAASPWSSQPVGDTLEQVKSQNMIARVMPIRNTPRTKIRRCTGEGGEVYNFDFFCAPPPEMVNGNPQPLVDANPDDNIIVVDAAGVAETATEDTLLGTEKGLQQQQQAVLLEQPRVCYMKLARMDNELYHSRHLTPQDFLEDICEKQRYKNRNGNGMMTGPNPRENGLELDIRTTEPVKLERKAGDGEGGEPKHPNRAPGGLGPQDQLQYQHVIFAGVEEQSSLLPRAPLPPEARLVLVKRRGETTAPIQLRGSKAAGFVRSCSRIDVLPSGCQPSGISWPTAIIATYSWSSIRIHSNPTASRGGPSSTCVRGHAYAVPAA